MILCSLVAKCIVMAGAFSTNLSIPEGTPLAGYGSIHRRDLFSNLFGGIFKSSTPAFLFRTFDARDPDGIRVSSIALQQKETILVLISLELVAVTSEFTKAIVEKVQNEIGRNVNVVVTATHTHSGPGGLAQNSIWQWGVADFYSSSFAQNTVNTVVATIVHSVRRMQPAQAEFLSVPIAGVSQNRRIEGGSIQSNANIIQWRSAADRKVIGGLLHYAIHGTAYGTKSSLLTGDVPGALTRAVEKMHWGNPTFVYLSGASGDVSPMLSGAEAMHTLPIRFTDQLRQAGYPNLSSLKVLDGSLKVSTTNVDLPPPLLNLQKCNVVGGYASTLMPHVHLGSFPRSTVTYQFVIGGVPFSTWPGEPIAALQKGSKSLIVSLANDYLGYFVTPAFANLNTYESCANPYGVWAWQQFL